MARYYFTLASLPELQLFIPPPITVEEFFQRCAAEVRKPHLNLLERISAGDWSVPHPVTDAWNSYMDDLNHELAYQRSESLGRKQERTRITDRDIQDAARHVLHQETPLESEKEYIRIQWGVLDDLETGHFFDVPSLVVYLMKLKIAQRYDLFDRQEGKNQYDQVFSLLRSRIESL